MAGGRALREESVTDPLHLASYQKLSRYPGHQCRGDNLWRGPFIYKNWAEKLAADIVAEHHEEMTAPPRVVVLVWVFTEENKRSIH